MCLKSDMTGVLMRKRRGRTKTEEEGGRPRDNREKALSGAAASRGIPTIASNYRKVARGKKNTPLEPQRQCSSGDNLISDF